MKKTYYAPNRLSDSDQILYDKIIELLKSKPHLFTARWSSDALLNNILDHSIRVKGGYILIMNSGSILRPFELELNDAQIAEIKSLVKPIFERDKMEMINSIFENLEKLQ